MHSGGSLCKLVDMATNVINLIFVRWWLALKSSGALLCRYARFWQCKMIFFFEKFKCCREGIYTSQKCPCPCSYKVPPLLVCTDPTMQAGGSLGNMVDAGSTLSMISVKSKGSHSYLIGGMLPYFVVDMHGSDSAIWRSPLYIKRLMFIFDRGAPFVTRLMRW